MASQALVPPSRKRKRKEGYLQVQLDTKKKQIRLLTLLPGQPDDLITCNLSAVDLDVNQQYDALSYAWGHRPRQWEARLNILVNDSLVLVRESLLQALVHLRSADSPRVLWVDAICIDQSNVEERNHQVTQMGEIYRQVTQVVVWLGTANETSRSAISFMREFLELGPVGQVKLRNDDRWEDVTDFCERPYWKRLWIIQEICLGKAAIVQCGADQLPWGYFHHLRMAIAHVWPKNTNMHERAYMMSLPARIDQQRAALKVLGQGTKLRTLLDIFRQSLCQVILDKVYGLLALSSDCGPSDIIVDYTKTPKNLYRDIVRFYNARGEKTLFKHDDKPFRPRPELLPFRQVLKECLGWGSSYTRATEASKGHI